MYTICIFICTVRLGSGTQSTLNIYSIWILFSITKNELSLEELAMCSSQLPHTYFRYVQEPEIS